MTDLHVDIFCAKPANRQVFSPPHLTLPVQMNGVLRVAMGASERWYLVHPALCKYSIAGRLLTSHFNSYHPLKKDPDNGL